MAKLRACRDYRATSTASSILGWMPQKTRYEPAFGKAICTVSPAGIEVELVIQNADIVDARVVVNDPLMQGLRTDVSFTLLLSESESYDGGELVIEGASGEDA